MCKVNRANFFLICGAHMTSKLYLWLMGLSRNENNIVLVRLKSQIFGYAVLAVPHYILTDSDWMFNI